MLYFRRLLYEDRLKNEIRNILPDSDDGKILAMIRRWFIEEHGQHNQHLFDDNRVVSEWLQSQLDAKGSLVRENIACLKRDAITRQMKK